MVEALSCELAEEDIVLDNENLFLEVRGVSDGGRARMACAVARVL